MNCVRILTSFVQTIAAEYTLGPLIANNQYYVGVIRGNFTRNIGGFFPDLMEEIILAIDENIPPGVKGELESFLLILSC